MDRYTFIHHCRPFIGSNPDLMRELLDICGTSRPKETASEDGARRPFESKMVHFLIIDHLKRMWRAPASYVLPERDEEGGHQANLTPFNSDASSIP
jgi:hypothetical protein